MPLFVAFSAFSSQSNPLYGLWNQHTMSTIRPVQCGLLIAAFGNVVYGLLPTVAGLDKEWTILWRARHGAWCRYFFTISKTSQECSVFSAPTSAWHPWLRIRCEPQHSGHWATNLGSASALIFRFHLAAFDCSSSLRFSRQGRFRGRWSCREYVHGGVVWNCRHRRPFHSSNGSCHCRSAR